MGRELRRLPRCLLRRVPHDYRLSPRLGVTSLCTESPEEGEASPSPVFVSITTVPWRCPALQFPKSFDRWIRCLWRGRGKPPGCPGFRGEIRGTGVGGASEGWRWRQVPQPVPRPPRSRAPSEQPAERCLPPPLPPPRSPLQLDLPLQPPRRRPPGPIPLAMAPLCHRPGSPGKRSFRKKLQQL